MDAEKGVIYLVYFVYFIDFIAHEAIKDFKERIKMYEKQYAEVGKKEGSYIKVIDVGAEIAGYHINGIDTYSILHLVDPCY